MGSWPEVADPPTPEFALAALPPSVPAPAPAPAGNAFSRLMQAKPKPKEIKPPQPTKGTKRPRPAVPALEVEVAAPPAKVATGRFRYAAGTPEGDRMLLALTLVQKGVKYKRAAEIYQVERTALGRIQKGEQKLHAVPGAGLVIHPKLEQDLHDFIVFVFERGHGIDWCKVCEYARELAKHMEIKDFQASAGWLSGFQQRHRDLVRRRAQAMERVRAGAMNADSVDHYFNTVLKSTYEFVEERYVTRPGLVPPSLLSLTSLVLTPFFVWQE